MKGAIIGSFLFVIIGEGILSWGLVFPWLWFCGRDRENENWYGYFVLILGLFTSGITGTIVGGLSVWWLVCLWILSKIKMVTGGNAVLTLIVLVMNGYFCDLIMGLKWDLFEAVVVSLFILLLMKIGEEKGGVRLRQNT